MVHLDTRHVGGLGQPVVEKTRGEELAVRVVDQLLVQGAADALGHAAGHLALDDHRVDQLPAVVDHHVAAQRHAAALRIDLHHHRVNPVGEGHRERIEGTLVRERRAETSQPTVAPG